MLNRRQMICQSTLAAAWMAAPRRLLAISPHSHASGTSPRLAPFQDPLRIPPVLTPIARGKTSFYTMTMRAGLTKLHRDLPPTVVWGFNGLYPGPTIQAVRGSPVVIRQFNQVPDHQGHAEMPQALPAVHLHGAHVAPEDDGHPREAIPRGGFRDYLYPNHQRAATLLYHDHSHGLTGLHVYYGLAGVYLITDPAENILNLPKGEYDVPLIIQDRILNFDGSFNYPLNDKTRESGVLGDTILVNGVVQPYLEVARRKYRFRIINASNARMYDLQLSSGRPLIQVGTDGGLLPEPSEKWVVTLGPFERAEVVIDFSAYPLGSQVVLKNCLSCTDGTADVMRFDVRQAEPDNSDLPDCLSEWADLPINRQVAPRRFILDRQSGQDGLKWVINDQTFDMNNPPLARVKLGDVERWQFVNPTTHPHPVHIHLIQFQILEVNGQPQDPSKHGWKDVFVVPPSGQIVVAARFEGYTGRYLFHCHNLEHEDLGMMADYEIVAEP
jgi:spore coat protein A